MATTSNVYGFNLPDPNDSMADVQSHLIANFTKLKNSGQFPIIDANDPLPQSGSYEVGDSVFKDDPVSFDLSPLVVHSWPSIYILVCKDPNWGWYWRPVQINQSPWFEVPASAISNSDFEIHPNYPLSIALDNQGWCHWRGAIRAKNPGLTPLSLNTTVFHPIPFGIRPNTQVMHTVPITPVVSATGKAGNVSSRYLINPTGVNHFRFFNTNNGISQELWFDGFKYVNAEVHYYNA